MVGVLVISHGPLAKALIRSVRSLTGRVERIRGISVWPKDCPKRLRSQIRKTIREVDEGDGVLVLTDLLGGTPTNLSLSSLESERDRVEVVTGVNLPMLLTLLSYREKQSLKEIGGLVKRSGRRSIIRVKEFFRMKR